MGPRPARGPPRLGAPSEPDGPARVNAGGMRRATRAGLPTAPCDGEPDTPIPGLPADSLGLPAARRTPPPPPAPCPGAARG